MKLHSTESGPKTRSVIDRTVDSLALGNTEATTLLANILNADASAPAQTPAILLDVKQDTFFRTNIALAFAKMAANNEAYEEAIEALNAATPEAEVDHSVRTNTRKVAWKASSASASLANTPRQTLNTVGPWRFRMASKAASFRSARKRYLSRTSTIRSAWLMDLVPPRKWTRQTIQSRLTDRHGMERQRLDIFNFIDDKGVIRHKTLAAKLLHEKLEVHWQS
jgi:hypothetical protein